MSVSKKESTHHEQVSKETWQARDNTAEFLAHQASLMQEHSVPNWDRGEAFSHEKQAWWQWQGLPAMSMAFSVLAIALVLFKVELVVQPEGVLLSFAGADKQLQQNQVVQLLDEKLQDFAAEQQVVMANYVSDLSSKQQETNLQLASYLMGATRMERQQDIADFVSYINAQRQDDQLEQKIQYQQISQMLGSKAAETQWSSPE
jgi:hypothetical protein